MEVTEPLCSNCQPHPTPQHTHTSQPERPPPPALVCSCIFAGLVVISAVFTLVAFGIVRFFPYPPEFEVDSIRLLEFRAQSGPGNATIAGSIEPTVSLTNEAWFFTLEYHRVGGAIAYRSTVLGSVDVNSGGSLGEKEVWSASFMLRFGSPVLGEDDESSLIKDLARDYIPLHMTVEAQLKMGFLLFYLPFQKTASCVVYASAVNQTILRQDCYMR